ncbi:hypothetical protein HDV02_002504 [Globomyces sp. JEL0801]|nr:hypothetical protein HDV02_002504 [Globomyces sp. JEL0801]
MTSFQTTFVDTKLSDLQKILDGFSILPSSFQKQADECKSLYNNAPLIRKMLNEKTTNQQVVTSRENCVQTIVELENSVSTALGLLQDIWDSQEKIIDEQITTVNSINQRLNILDRQTGIHHLGFSKQSINHKRNRKIVRNGEHIPTLGKKPNFKLSLSNTRDRDLTEPKTRYNVFLSEKRLSKSQNSLKLILDNVSYFSPVRYSAKVSPKQNAEYNSPTNPTKEETEVSIGPDELVTTIEKVANPLVDPTSVVKSEIPPPPPPMPVIVNNVADLKRTSVEQNPKRLTSGERVTSTQPPTPSLSFADELGSKLKSRSILKPSENEIGTNVPQGAAVSPLLAIVTNQPGSLNTFTPPKSPMKSPLPLTEQEIKKLKKRGIPLPPPIPAPVSLQVLENGICKSLMNISWVANTAIQTEKGFENQIAVCNNQIPDVQLASTSNKITENLSQAKPISLDIRRSAAIVPLPIETTFKEQVMNEKTGSNSEVFSPLQIDLPSRLHSKNNSDVSRQSSIKNVTKPIPLFTNPDETRSRDLSKFGVGTSNLGHAPDTFSTSHREKKRLSTGHGNDGLLSSTSCRMMTPLDGPWSITLSSSPGNIFLSGSPSNSLLPELVNQETDTSPTEEIITVQPDMLTFALADFEATVEEHLSLTEGETYVVLQYDYGNGWAYGCTLDGSSIGVFPQTYVDYASSEATE